jgi:hypothetical protein
MFVGRCARLSIVNLSRAELALDALNDSTGTIVLVEGESDAIAVETLAARLDGSQSGGLHVLSAYGITNYRKLLTRIRTDAPQRRVVGLYDEPEEHVIQRALASSGIGRPKCRAEIEQLGFFACVADLEDELIRALGVDRVEQLVDDQGELPAFRIMQRQPAQRDRSVAQQLRRFMGTKSMRKIRYGHLLAAAVDLGNCPQPLHRVIAAAEPDAALR